MRFSVGDQPVPGYVLETFLGAGNYGEVWQAAGPGGVPCALKFIRLDSQSGMKEFRSIGLVKKIRHPNLVPVMGVWLRDEQGRLLGDGVGASLALGHGGKDLVLAMGLGQKTLSQRLADFGGGGIPPDELVPYMTGAAEGIDHLNDPIHDMGTGPAAIIHCDIKPANLLIVGGGVQVCDYGVAKAVAQNTRKTQTAGTPAYAPPELLNNEPCPQTDQYSLAITYYELRTGTLPFDENKALVANLTGQLDFSRVPPAEREVLKTATAMRPDQRFESCTDLAAALKQATGVKSRRSRAAAGQPGTGEYSVPGGPGSGRASDPPAPAVPSGSIPRSDTARAADTGTLPFTPEQHPAPPPPPSADPAGTIAFSAGAAPPPVAPKPALRPEPTASPPADRPKKGKPPVAVIAVAGVVLVGSVAGLALLFSGKSEPTGTPPSAAATNPPPAPTAVPPAGDRLADARKAFAANPPDVAGGLSALDGVTQPGAAELKAAWETAKAAAADADRPVTSADDLPAFRKRYAPPPGLADEDGGPLARFYQRQYARKIGRAVDGPVPTAAAGWKAWAEVCRDADPTADPAVTPLANECWAELAALKGNPGDPPPAVPGPLTGYPAYAAARRAWAAGFTPTAFLSAVDALAAAPLKPKPAWLNEWRSRGVAVALADAAKAVLRPDALTPASAADVGRALKWLDAAPPADKDEANTLAAALSSAGRAIVRQADAWAPALEKGGQTPAAFAADLFGRAADLAGHPADYGWRGLCRAEAPQPDLAALQTDADKAKNAPAGVVLRGVIAHLRGLAAGKAGRVKLALEAEDRFIHALGSDDFADRPDERAAALKWAGPNAEWLATVGLPHTGDRPAAGNGGAYLWMARVEKLRRDAGPVPSEPALPGFVRGALKAVRGTPAAGPVAADLANALAADGTASIDLGRPDDASAAVSALGELAAPDVPLSAARRAWVEAARLVLGRREGQKLNFDALDRFVSDGLKAAAPADREAVVRLRLLRAWALFDVYSADFPDKYRGADKSKARSAAGTEDVVAAVEAGTTGGPKVPDFLLGEVYGLRGLFEFAAGQDDDARAAFTKAVELAPLHPVAFSWKYFLSTYVPKLAAPERLAAAASLAQEAVVTGREEKGGVPRVLYNFLKKALLPHRDDLAARLAELPAADVKPLQKLAELEEKVGTGAAPPASAAAPDLDAALASRFAADPDGPAAASIRRRCDWVRDRLKP